MLYSHKQRLVNITYIKPKVFKKLLNWLLPACLPACLPICLSMSESISVSVAIIGALRLFRETTAQASSD